MSHFSAMSKCPKCSVEPREWVQLSPEFQRQHALLATTTRLCQDCYMASLYNEDERKQMVDARVEPEFHHNNPYGIPFVSRDGVLSVRVRGSERPLRYIFDHPDIVSAQKEARDRQCSLCMRWDTFDLSFEPGVFPRDRLWCGACRKSLRQSRERAQVMNRLHALRAARR